MLFKNFALNYFKGLDKNKKRNWSPFTLAYCDSRDAEAKNGLLARSPVNILIAIQAPDVS